MVSSLLIANPLQAYTHSIWAWRVIA